MSLPAEQGNHDLDDVDGDLKGRRSEREQHAAQAPAHNIRMSGQRERLDPECSHLDAVQRQQERHVRLPFDQ